MRRLIGPRDYLHVVTHALAAGDDATILTPLACMVRVKLTSVATGASCLYRNVQELETPEGGADATDTAALDADFCDVLDATQPDSGWIDVQPSGLRIEAVTDAVTVKVMWTSRNKPAIA
jgi:hypothetical protein